MSFFVDANVPIFAAHRSPQQPSCIALLLAVAAGARGRMSTAAVEEVWHVELTRPVGVKPGLAQRTLATFAPLLTVTEEVVREALTLDAPRLGANDRIHVATCRANGIDTIVTADAGFDAVPGLTRIDPLDREGIDSLLAA